MATKHVIFLQIHQIKSSESLYSINPSHSQRLRHTTSQLVLFVAGLASDLSIPDAVNTYNLHLLRLFHEEFRPQHKLDGLHFEGMEIQLYDLRSGDTFPPDCQSFRFVLEQIGNGCRRDRYMVRDVQ